MAKRESIYMWCPGCGQLVAAWVAKDRDAVRVAKHSVELRTRRVRLGAETCAASGRLVSAFTGKELR